MARWITTADGSLLNLANVVTLDKVVHSDGVLVSAVSVSGIGVRIVKVADHESADKLLETWVADPRPAVEAAVAKLVEVARADYPSQDDEDAALALAIVEAVVTVVELIRS